MDRTELANALEELGYIGAIDGEVEPAPRWADYSEGQRWLITWGVLWRTWVSWLAIALILGLIAYAGGSA